MTDDDRTAFEEHMDDLAHRIGEVLDGESAINAASVLVICMAWCCADGFGDDKARRRAFEKVIAFARSEFEGMVRHSKAHPRQPKWMQ